VKLNYVQHRWGVHPLLPKGRRFVARQTDDYTAYFKLSIHSIQSQLRVDFPAAK
jgi:hypothetical protein